MEIGSAIALVGVAVPAGAVVITAINVYRPKNGNSNGKAPFPCPEHSGVCEVLKSMEKKLDKICDHLNLLG